MNINMKSYKVRRVRALVAFLLLTVTLLGLVGGATIKTFAASYDTTMLWLEDDITKVSDLDSGISKCKIDIGSMIKEPEAEIAIPIDLSKYSDGTVQMRWYCTNKVGDTFEVYLVKEEDIYSAINISGVARIAYGSISKGSAVQGLTRIDNGVCNWNLPVKGRSMYYLVVRNTRALSAGEKLDDIIYTYGYGDITLEFVYKAASKAGGDGSYLTPKTIYRDLISLVNTELTYYVKADAASLATLYFTFDGETAGRTGNGLVEIFNSYGELVASKQVAAYDANSRTEFSLALDTEEGQTYTVKMSGIQGATTMRMDTSSANVELTQLATDIVASDTVYVNTNGIAVSSIQYVEKDIPENLLDNGSSWIGVKSVTDAKFEVTKNGTYTVRVMGNNAKYYYSKITISNIDNSVPDFGDTPSFSNSAIKIEVNDDKLAYITINGKKCLKGAIINEEGMHNIQAADFAGNVVSMTACVDRTAPYMRNTQLYNGCRLAPGYYSFDVVDDLAGVDFVMVDGQRQSGYNNKYSITISSNHEILIVDLCGNQTTIRVGTADANNNTSANNNGYNNNYNSGYNNNYGNNSNYNSTLSGSIGNGSGANGGTGGIN